MADEDNLNEGFLKKAVRAVAGKRNAAGRAKEAYKNQRAYGQDARATNGGFSDEDEKQLTRMQSTKRRYDRIASGEKPFRKAKQGEYISKMGEDISTTFNIISILESAEPSAGLKDAVYAALSERVTGALNEYKKMVAESYFGQPDDLSEESLDEVTWSPTGQKDRLTKEEVSVDEGKSLLTKIHRAVAGQGIARMRADKHEKAGAAERFGGPKGLNGTPVATKKPDQKKIDRLDRAATRNYRIARGAKPFLTNNTHYMDDDLDEAVKKQATIAQKNKAIKAFEKAGKYRPDPKLRFAPLKFKKDRKSARENSQARYNSSPESEAYWSS
jgi:hypothetical protein